MKTQGIITLIEKPSEIKGWLNKQPVTRKITRLQVHHTALPDYNTWEKTDKKVFSEPHFGRANSLDSYAKKTWNSKSANGSYQAQHFVVFPDGMITTGRSLNSNPIGISGWNTNAICIEIYGNFDKGKDVMNAKQKEAVIALYSELCLRFNIVPSASTIRYHCFFTSNGTYLGTYVAGKSRKTCPGTNFMGFGNTKEAFEKKFIPLIKDYIAKGKVDVSTPAQPSTPSQPNTSTNYVAGVYKINTSELNVRQSASASSSTTALVKQGESYTVTEVVMNGTTPWGKLKSGIGYINLQYAVLVKATEVAFKKYIVRTNVELNGREEASASSDIVLLIPKGAAITIVGEEMNGDTKWLKTASGYYLSASYTTFVRYV